MHYTRIVSTADGSSLFIDAELELSDGVIADGVPPLLISELLATSAAIFLEDPSDASGWQFHPSPAKALVVITSGRLSVETGDGERREFGVGEVLSIEDTTGMGHLSMPVAKETRMLMLVLSEHE